MKWLKINVVTLTNDAELILFDRMALSLNLWYVSKPHAAQVDVVQLMLVQDRLDTWHPVLDV